MGRKIISFILTLCLMSSIMTLSIGASETFEYSILASTVTPRIGSEFEVTISLTNYAELQDEIRGLQIDITNIDSSILEVVSHNSVVEDSNAASNKTSYSSANNYVRYVYLKLSGTMDKNVKDIMKFKLKVKDDLAESGKIVLPITIKIGTTSENITLKDELTINYTEVGSGMVNVDITWGTMEFIYDDGNWDTTNHKWVDSGWKPAVEDGNLISVVNNGSSDVKVGLNYVTSDIANNLTGYFCDSLGNRINSAVTLNADGIEQDFRFNLQGKTDSRWNDEFIKLGTITISIID